MKSRLALLTKLLVLVSLILATVPSGATETVCVVGTKKQVAPNRRCGMPCCAHQVQAEPPKASCCKPKAKPQSETCGTASLSCHCETRYVATNSPAPIADTKLSVLPIATAILDEPLRLVRTDALVLSSETSVRGADISPPRKLPRAPMRGRAPPVTNR